ncbi:MAG: hypothetical protein K2W82_11150 [Candidatus Obscuribacterales bacterium]|nr:hypothetical protein [Candidatus Obscuribacterales bacterium]
MTSGDKPRPISVFLCERILRDVLRPEAISIVNMHNSIGVQTFPAVVPLVFAFSEVTGSHFEFTYQFKFLDRQGQLIAVSNIQTVAALPNTNMTHKLIGAFQGLVFPEEGTYQLVLALAGEDVSSLAIQIVHVPPSPAVA